MNLTEMKAAVEKFNTSLAASEAKILALEKTVADLTAANTDLTSKLVALEANAASTIATIKASSGEAVAKLEGSIVALEAKIKTADAKAIDIAARAGVPAVEDHQVSQEKSADDIRAEFKAITNHKDRAAFYEKHRKVLVG